MENKIIAPHLNAEVYYRNENIVPSPQSFLDFIRIHEDDIMLVGCSELTGRYWDGGAYIIDTQQADELSQKKLARNINLITGTADGIFFNSSHRIILCEDSGSVGIWSYIADWGVWSEDVSVEEHDAAALVIDRFELEGNFLTAGADGNVKVWDMNENMMCTRNYSSAHGMVIYGLSVRPLSMHNFASGSLDHSVKLWDQRVEKEVCELVHNDCGVRCVQWMDEHHVVFGDEAGILTAIDCRNRHNIAALQQMPAAIHKVAVEPETKKMAVCCDSRTVYAFDVRGIININLMYENDEHDNFGRGVAWDVENKNVFYSVGWDGAVKKQTIISA